MNPNTIFLIDRDVDCSESILYKIIKSQNNAFSRPSIIKQYIDEIDKDEIINLVINTNGGSLANLEKILKKLLEHPAGYRVYIKDECYSAGAFITLGAKEIIMNDNSYIGKIDPQSDSKQAIIYAKMPEKYIDSHNAYLVYESKYILNYTNNILDKINLDDEVLNKVKEKLLDSELPHQALFDFDECLSMGLPVRRPTESEKVYFENHNIKDYRIKNKKLKFF